MNRLAASLTVARTRMQDAVQGRLVEVRSAGRRDTGATLIEYVVIAAGTCLAAIALVALITTVVGKYSADIK